MAEQLGWDLMPWQRYVAGVALEHDVGGLLAYRDVAIAVPRQSGKSSLMLSLLAWRMLSSPGQRAVYGAQNRLSARTKLFDTWWPRLKRSPLRDMFSLGRATGAEQLRCVNGSICSLLSSEESAAHGETLDLAVLDEAWAMTAAAEQAVKPAMATRPAAQCWIVSTAGTDRSVFWRSRVDAGRLAVDSGVSDGLAYFEWSAADDDDPGDVSTWAACMPALNHTITPGVVAADMAVMLPGEFRRAYLNQWPSEAGGGWQVIPKDLWMAAEL